MHEVVVGVLGAAWVSHDSAHYLFERLRRACESIHYNSDNISAKIRHILTRGLDCQHLLVGDGHVQAVCIICILFAFVPIFNLGQ